jgi:hypothetical protein
MGLPKHDRAMLMPHLYPPADSASTAQRLSEIKVRLKKEMAAERARAFLNQAPPSVVKSQLEALERQLSRLSPQAERALHQALEAALWEENPASGRALQLLVRCNDGVVRGTWPGGDLGLVGEANNCSVWPPHDILHRAVALAIARLESKPAGNPGTIGPAGRRAAQALIDLHCQVHGGPPPRFHVRKQDVVDRAPAEFAVTCLKHWGIPNALDIDVIDLVRSLRV